MKRSNILLTILFCVALALFMISFSISMPILFRPFYYWQIKPLGMQKELAEWGINLDKAQIKQAYNEVLDFCTLPWDKSFSAGQLAFSQEGADHFADCKKLFMLDFGVEGVTLAIVVLLLVLNKLQIITLASTKNHNAYFFSACFAIWLPVMLVLIIAMVGFDEAFQVFHAIFFPGKDNWLFDPTTDQIIIVMPEQFFMNCGVLIAVTLACFSSVLVGVDLYKHGRFSKKRAS